MATAKYGLPAGQWWKHKIGSTGFWGRLRARNRSYLSEEKMMGPEMAIECGITWEQWIQIENAHGRAPNIEDWQKAKEKMMGNDQRYDDRDLPSGHRPPDAPDLSDPSRAGRPNSPDHHKLHSGTATVRHGDQLDNG